MPYSLNYWTGDAAKLECTGWIQPRNAFEILRKLEKIKFTYQSERNTVPDIIDELEGGADDCIYTIDVQFPLKNFIPLQCDEVVENIKNVLLAASYRPPDVSETDKDLTTKTLQHASNKQGSSKPPTEQSDSSSKDQSVITQLQERNRFEKSQKLFYESLSSLKKSLKSCTLNRITFETKYNLTFT